MRNGALGAILRFQRVRPRRSDPLQLFRSDEITPAFLDRAVRALRRWKYEIVPIGEVPGRMADDKARRFVCLTFDGGSRDLIDHAYPVLSRHQAPFAVYLPTGLMDGVAQAWWLSLENIIARHDRLNLVMNGEERRFKTADLSDKRSVYLYLADHLSRLPLADRSDAIADLCGRYGANSTAITQAYALNWEQIGILARDPLVTIGTATVNLPLLSALAGPDASREIRMGRAVAEAATGQTLPHFAYPFGRCESFGRREIELVREAGFATAVTSAHGPLLRGRSADALALPRIDWDGNVASLRVLRAALAGVSG